MIKYFILLLCLSPFILSAQVEKDTTRAILDRTEIKVGYIGNVLWNNGILTGAEYLWKEKSRTKEIKDKQKTITRQFLFTSNLAYTTNFSSKTDAGSFANFGLAWRRTNTKGKQISIALNPIAYYRSFLTETYEVVGTDVKKVFLPGRSYYAPSLSIGFGKRRENKRLSGRYFNVHLMYRMPYNAGALPSISLQYGFRFNPKKTK